MSERPMTVPDPELAGLTHLELVLSLDAGWPLETDAGHWPVQLLQDLGVLPHRYGTWLWEGHTVPNGDPAEPYAPGTALCGAIIAAPVLVPDAFAELEHAGTPSTSAPSSRCMPTRCGSSSTAARTSCWTVWATPASPRAWSPGGRASPGAAAGSVCAGGPEHGRRCAPWHGRSDGSRRCGATR
jgi:hypothetical protein